MSPPIKIRGAWRPLVDQAGGVTALALKLDVSVSTLRRWIAGTVRPIGPTREFVDDYAKARSCKSPW